MADKIYRLKDVEKGKKLEFVITYYKWYIISALFLIAFVSVGIYEYTHITHNDISLLLIEENAKYNQNNLLKIQNSLENLDIDFNNDGKKNAYVQPIIKNVEENGNSGDFNELAFSELSVGECNIIVFDEKMFEYLKNRNALESYENLEINGEGIIKIPYGETLLNSFVKEEEFEREMFVSIKKVKNPDELYKKQVEFFKEKLIKGEQI